MGGKLPAIGFDLLAKNYSLAILKLLREIDRRLDDEKQRLSVLDFDDLQLRTLRLLDHMSVLVRVSERYRYFLVDEFQDTNGLQRDLLTKLALGRGTNLFIVGDRKQSIYGFRGADVDVFSEMTATMKNAGGAEQPLQLNFRSQKPLIDSLNFLFAKIFQSGPDVPSDELSELGHVEHEPGVAVRELEHDPPHVEFLLSAVPEDEDKDVSGKYRSSSFAAHERDAEQVAARIRALVKTGSAEILSANQNGRQDARTPRYKDIAILLRAFTGVWTYESALRRAGIPYLTVQGKGFYQREEITDLIQLLRFLDNTTDELALAAILRSPLGGISDNALLALRCAPWIDEEGEPTRLHRRNLLRALRRHREIKFIDTDEHVALDRVALWIDSMIARRNRYSIADLLETTVSEALPVLENIPQVRQKLQTLVDVGLGYIHLGQSATTLSGGEAQRIKLARELSKRQTGKTLYLLDEPTTGLHFDDVKKLLAVLHRLTDLGNSVIIIEHNLDVVRSADWLIDLGPEGGEHGGQVVAQGTPEQVARSKKSYTGQALAGLLAKA